MNNIDKYRDLQKEEKPSTFESVVPALLMVIEHRSQKADLPMMVIEGDDGYRRGWRPDMEKETTEDKVGVDGMPADPQNTINYTLIGLVLIVVFILGMCFLLWCYSSDANKKYDTKSPLSVQYSSKEEEERNNIWRNNITGTMKLAGYSSLTTEKKEQVKVALIRIITTVSRVASTSGPKKYLVAVDIDDKGKNAQFLISENFTIKGKFTVRDAMEKAVCLKDDFQANLRDRLKKNTSVPDGFDVLTIIWKKSPDLDLKPKTKKDVIPPKVSGVIPPDTLVLIDVNDVNEQVTSI